MTKKNNDKQLSADIAMRLEHFRIPRFVYDNIRTLEPQDQGMIYNAIFARIYDDNPAPGEALDGYRKVIYDLVLEYIHKSLKRRHAYERAKVRRALAKAEAAASETVTEAQPAELPQPGEIEAEGVAQIGVPVVQQGQRMVEGETWFHPQLSRRERRELQRKMRNVR